MNEKLENFKNKILSFLLKIFSPILGKQAISKENRFAIELDDEGISVCKYNQGSKTITNLHHEEFNLAGKTSLFNEEDQVYYSQKIVHILKEQKLLEKEATVILPTSETIIKTINIPLMDQETFDLQTSDIEFWKTFEELSDIIENKIFSFQPLAINEETQEQEVVICLIEREKVEKLNKILRQSGVKPTIYEPKCFSLINTIFANQKDNKTKEFAFLEYGEKENYLITVTQLPFAVVDFINYLELTPLGIILVICVIYLVLGTVMDSLAMLFLTIPVFFPVIVDAGIDPVWFGIFAVIVVEFGLVSPPVGMNLFVIKGVMQNTPLQTIWFGTIPFLLTDVIRVALIIAFPAICLYLPSLMASS